METWKTVAGFTDYEVSDLGRVRRVVSANNNHTPKILRARNNGMRKDGYLYVVLYNSGKRHNKAVHILVATAFVPNPKSLPEVNHLRKTTNNKAGFLEWRSLLGHRQDQVKRGQKGKGISYRKDLGKWQARYTNEQHRRVTLGFYTSAKEAQEERNTAVSALPRVE